MDDVWKGLTLVVGLGVVYVAFQQYRLAREKLKLELFEKRFAVFAAARAFLSFILVEAKAPIGKLFEYRGSVAEASFLFGEEITGYLDEIDKKALRFHTTNQIMGQRPVVPNHAQIIEENSALLAWLVDQLPQLKVRFAPYLKFKTWI